jgi:hypothetical protein
VNGARPSAQKSNVNNDDEENMRISLARSFIYDDLSFCFEVLRSGIKARKFHYSRKTNKECTIFFDSDPTKVFWRYGPDKTSGKKSSIDLDLIQGVVFGAFSSTFT